MHPRVEGDDFLSGLLDMESLPEFSNGNNITLCVHEWVDGSANKGQARFGVFFLFGEYANVS